MAQGKIIRIGLFDLPTKVIPLTKRLQVENGAHILYFYNSRESYVEQAASFVISGIKQQQYIIFVDTPDIYESVMAILQESLSIVDMQLITYINNYDFYEMYHDFNFERVIQNLQDILGPYIKSDATVRLWGHVDWLRGSSNVVQGLALYESHCDISVSELGFLTVCAYDATIVPAYIQTEMMRTHPYFMTDYELLRSNLYKSVQPGSTTIFPSLSSQADMENEVDLYKKKLDFVHVVSHEVRNPLTIIRAYAKMLHSQETNPIKAQKLSAILDYCTVIDHEIAHIIATEEMLSTDAIWRRSIVFPVPLLQEVLETLGAKARTHKIFPYKVKSMWNNDLPYSVTPWDSN